jgi:hypothetical protein
VWLSSCVFAGLSIYVIPIVFIGFNPPGKAMIGPANCTVLDLLHGETPSAPTRVAVWFAKWKAMRLCLVVLLVLLVLVPHTTNVWRGRKEGVLLCVFLVGLVALLVNLVGLLSIIAII